MREKYKKTFRAYEVGYHAPEPPIVALKNLDVKEYEKLFRIANIDSLWVYCKDHWGLCNYDTKIGKKHPGLKIDLVEELSAFCRKNNIEFVAYYSVGFDNYAATTHDDWAMRDENGEKARVYRKFPRYWHRVCINTPYRDYALKQIEEILDYKPDALFLDIYYDDYFCYCKHCQESWQKQYGFPQPKGEEAALAYINDPELLSIGEKVDSKYTREIEDFIHYQYQLSFLKAVRDLINRKAPGTALTINGGFAHCRKELLDLCTYTYAESLGWVKDYGFNCGAFARGTGTYTQLHPGAYFIVFDNLPKSIYIYSTAAVAAQGCRVFIADIPQHPDGTLDKVEFEYLGVAYGEIKKYQPLLQNRSSIKTVGIVYSEDSRINGRGNHPIMAKNNPHSVSLFGAIESVSYAKYPLEIIPEWKINKPTLSEYEILILPNVSCITDTIAKDISEFVKNGGILLSSHISSLLDGRGKTLDNFLLADIFGCDFKMINDKFNSAPWGSYLNKTKLPIWENIPPTENPTMPPTVEVKHTSGKILATHIFPATVWTDETWVNWLSPPPKEETDLPAIILNNYGKGKSVYFSFDFFRMCYEASQSPFENFRWPKWFLLSLLENLLPVPKIRLRSETPSALLATFFKNDKKEHIIHVLNHTVLDLKGEIMEVPGGMLQIRKDFFQPKSAYLVYPEKKVLKIDKQKQTYHIYIPKVKIHNIVVIK